MEDHLSPVSLARFRFLEVDEVASDLSDAPNREGKASAIAWLRQFIAAYLKQLPWQERPRRLIAALAESSIEVVFGATEISSRDQKWAEGFATDFASLNHQEQLELRDEFPKIAREQLEAQIAEARRRSYGEGETAADDRFTFEKNRLEGEIRSLKRRLRVLSGKVSQVILFGLLLVSSVAFTVWLVGLLDPEVAQVTIEYNVGEIIAGILGGAGAAAAGIGYAAKTLRSGEDREKSNE